MTLRHVERATGRVLSNAYLSQIEHGRIAKPSPNILHSLAKVYNVSYETLMEKAGYMMATSDNSKHAHRRVAAFALEDLKPEEEEELLSYLAFLRYRPIHSERMKPDDQLDDPQVLGRIRAIARRALNEADALGVRPTPIDDIIEAAQHRVHETDRIDEGFLKAMTKKAAGRLKRALSKVWGLLDVRDRTMHLDLICAARQSQVPEST